MTETPKKPIVRKSIIRNRRATYEYEILEKWDAGLVLVGTEVKSLRAKNVTVADAFVEMKNGEAWLRNVNIAQWKFGNRNNHEPNRPKKLLLHGRELDKLSRGVEEKGLTIVPLELYFERGLVKCKIALGRGKKLHDKRASIHAKEAKRDMARQMKAGRQGY